MAEIRPFEEGDVGPACRLIESLLPGWDGHPDFLRASILDHPWADSELPSLVAVEPGGEVIGFIGAQARRLRFRDRELRGVCCSHLVVSAEHRKGAAGALLLRRLLGGPQDATWSDSASPLVARMWTAFGGQRDHVRACDWMFVLRPVRWVGTWVAAGVRRRGIGRETVPVAAFPLPARGRRRRTPAPGVESAEASPEQVVELLPQLRRTFALAVDYDAAHLGHLFDRVREREGSLSCRLVRRDAEPIGWYVYVPRRSGASRVLLLEAAENDAGDVLDELLAEARGAGARVVTGRIEPHFEVALQQRRASLGLARDPVIHARDPELRIVLAAGEASLSRLDGEWFVA